MYILIYTILNIETIEKNIENLNKLKSILIKKINKVGLQLQKDKTRLSHAKEIIKLKHLQQTMVPPMYQD